MRSIKQTLATLAMILLSAAALAQAGLINAKQQGQIGERPDGLVAAVAGDASAAIRELVAEVNAERMAEYRAIAANTDSPLSAVQARAGRQIIERLPQGQYFMDAAGRWRQK